MTASVLLGVSFMLIRSELTSPELRFAADNRVGIDYPMYSYGFQAEDIRDIALVGEMPAGTQSLYDRLKEHVASGMEN